MDLSKAGPCLQNRNKIYLNVSSAIRLLKGGDRALGELSEIVDDDDSVEEDMMSPPLETQPILPPPLLTITESVQASISASATEFFSTWELNNRISRGVYDLTDVELSECHAAAANRTGSTYDSIYVLGNRKAKELSSMCDERVDVGELYFKLLAVADKVLRGYIRDKYNVGPDITASQTIVDAPTRREKKASATRRKAGYEHQQRKKKPRLTASRPQRTSRSVRMRKPIQNAPFNAPRSSISLSGSFSETLRLSQTSSTTADVSRIVNKGQMKIEAKALAKVKKNKAKRKRALHSTKSVDLYNPDVVSKVLRG